MKDFRAEINEDEFDNRITRFTQSVQERHAIKTHLFWIFLMMWLCAWGVSALLHLCNLKSMPLRYAIAFLIAYGAFYVLVQYWIKTTNWENGAKVQPDIFWSTVGGVAVIGFIKLFIRVILRIIPTAIMLPLVVILLTISLMSTFAAPLIVEVVFEMMFAGIVVRTLKGKTEIGEWHSKLFQITWLPALLIGSFLCIIAWIIQKYHPQVATFSEAIRLL